MKKCEEEGCESEHSARGLCNRHYARWRNKQHGLPLSCTFTCAWCGVSVQRRKPGKYCSHKCSCDARRNPNVRKIGPKNYTKTAPCKLCQESFERPLGGRRLYCSKDCRKKADALRAPLNAAIVNSDYPTILTLIENMSTVVQPSGCWEWPVLSSAGYPRHNSTSTQMHRMALEAKHGRPLGVLQAHHVCANRACVNPDHLQIVTQHENIAEMRARKTYVDRITELEDALAELDPSHPMLSRISIAV